jgi:phospholipid transport system substrate-binding protein
MRRRVAAPVLAALTLVSAAADAGEPTERLRALFDRANGILTSSDEQRGFDERVAAIRGLVSELFDAREAAATAVGREWQARSAAQRAEFERLYADLVERAYLSWVGARARLHADGVRVAFVSESTTGEAASVLTTLTTRGAGDMPVEYRMRRREGRWLVHDVIVDGLSVADSYRVQFQRVLQDGGWSELVARMYEKVSPAAPAEAAAPVRVAAAGVASDAPAVETPRMPMPAPAPSPAAEATPDAEPRPAADPLPAVKAAPADATVTRAMAAVAPARSSAPSVAKSVATGTARRATSFWLQLGAFRDTDAVMRLVERLRDRRVTIATDGHRAGALTRVLVGPFGDRAAATAALRQLTTAGYRAFIASE